jgi:hypothetical protein
VLLEEKTELQELNSGNAEVVLAKAHSYTAVSSSTGSSASLECSFKFVEVS